nr:hypothetical protein [Tanacetum cinerariifolium]
MLLKSASILFKLTASDVSLKKSYNLFSNDIALPKDSGSGKHDPPLEMILETLEVTRGTNRLSIRTVVFEFPLLLRTSLSLLTSSYSFYGAFLFGIASSFFAVSFEVTICALWNQFGRVINLRGDSFSFTA